MAMPIFTPGDDPGSSFPELLRRIGAFAQQSPAADGAGANALDGVPHATTCVAMRYADGVVMAGDRRATAGNLISHRAMEKVVEADRFSGVAIAGAAGPAMDMVKLFQLQLEHYEKVEGTSLSLEGKANQLVDDDPRQPAGGDDGPRRRADLRRLRRAPRPRSAVGLRRHRRPLRGARVRRHRLRQPARRHGRQARLASRPRSRRGHRPRVPGAVGGRRRRLARPAAPTSCAASTRSSPRSRPTAGTASTTPSCAERYERIAPSLRENAAQ